MKEDVDKKEEIHTPEETSVDDPASVEDSVTDGEASAEDPEISVDEESPEQTDDPDDGEQLSDNDVEAGEQPSDDNTEIGEQPESDTPQADVSRQIAAALQKPTKKEKRFSLSTVILVVLLLAGIGIISYPTVSDWWNSMHATQAIAGYVAAVETMTKEDKEAIIQKARDFNATLPNGANFTLSPERYAEYESVLDITGTGIMGYIQIGAIGVDLPVYHGTDEAILQIAVGHLAGTSFPVGGDRTHAVMSGHRGLPSAKLFTDLDKLKEGDTFTVTVLDQTITYAIDQIRIVLPEETDELAIQNGHDYATLVTCTPYGVNSHRILMRGTRVENLDAVATPAEAVRIPTYIVMPAIGIPILFILLVTMLLYYRWKGKRRTAEEILDEIKGQ